MRALMIRKTGGPEVLEAVTLPRPQPGPGEVLLRVRAVGLNFADILTVAGKYLSRPPLPLVPGMEFAGTVEQLGSGVSGLEVGQTVAALAGHGGFAEYASVPASAVVPVPESLSAAEAAAFPVSYFTAYFALRTLGHAQPGESVLVQAAAGALGTATVQVAKALDLTVIALASSEEKLALCRRLGADHTLLNSREDLVQAVRDRTDGRGVDLLTEVVGGEGFASSLQMLAPLGRVLVIGAASGQTSQLVAQTLMRGNQAVIGVWVTPLAADPVRMREASGFLSELIAGGQVRPVIGRTFPLEQAAEAFAFVTSRASTGKVILEP
nr:NADPH:quinone oxidoreductase family protein [Deinobacterium chartae]